MDKLPKELWIEIFDYLKAKDLIALTECCKDFYSIIIDTKLMKKFTLHLKNDNFEWLGERKYSKIEIKECNDLEKYINIFSAVGLNVLKISIINIQLNSGYLLKIFKCCPKLQEFYFSNVKIFEDIELQSLDNNKIIERIVFEDSSPVIFKLFINTSVKEIWIDNKCSNENVDFIPLRDLLKIQEYLKELRLAYFSINTNLFNDNVLDFVPFRLEKFSMNNVYLGIESVARFHTFLLNHKESLRFIFLQSPFINVSFFNQFYFLEELQLCHTNAFFEPFENIKKLQVENVSGNFMDKFPNAEELTMIYKYGVFLGMYGDLVKLTKLEKLTVIDSKIPELKIPLVKKLKLKNVVICHKRPFKYEENSIRELYIESCNTIDWIPDYLA
ncbi:hypothetical protein PVAND_003006 [Polypedilum vanderplanki]|uniref:F-box domain-containing protein n=1 Tax=Polypedilum vanderplanki TaxID=319348 RepID=A0A9J6BUE6_POLVA|nr:hypothetical protein PVAND_003006 [Polypedilum vanderplanki]